MSEQAKKIILSGIKPTGTPTLGNYLGALRNWVAMQDEYQCFYMVADMHAITIRVTPADLRRQTLEMVAILLACGINPDKRPLFIQSHVPAHAELSWALSCFTQFGELSRMTQFKDKSNKSENINAGLFCYPVLMAADVLLYNADMVPVGEDQKQHLELARNIAGRFNSLYSETFKLPEPYIGKVAARVRSLQNPGAKMAKSDEDENGTISILEKPEDILRKFKRAVTDSEAVVKVGKDKDGVNNLIAIYSAATGKTATEIEREFEGKGYGQFKPAVAEAVIALLGPIQQKYHELMANKNYLEQITRDGAARAAHAARRTLDKVYRKIGFVGK